MFSLARANFQVNIILNDIVTQLIKSTFAFHTCKVKNSQDVAYVFGP